jgi:hypothetical protein
MGPMQLNFTMWQPEASGAAPPVTGYVAEDGTTPYVAEDGTTPYVPET